MEKSDFKQIDSDYWLCDKGYIRLVTYEGRKLFTCWNHFMPAIGYFRTFEEAMVAMGKQGKHD